MFAVVRVCRNHFVSQKLVASHVLTVSSVDKMCEVVSVCFMFVSVISFVSLVSLLPASVFFLSLTFCSLSLPLNSLTFSANIPGGV